jgi:hypothetical protein
MSEITAGVLNLMVVFAGAALLLVAVGLCGLSMTTIRSASHPDAAG